MPDDFPNDDLFAGTKMTFGQHLEELRKVLFRSAFWLIATLIIGCWVGEIVVDWIKLPLERSLKKYYEAKAVRELREKHGTLEPEIENAIRADHIAPEVVELEPESALESLRDYDPGMFPGGASARYRFVPADIREKKLLPLCQKLLAGEDAQPESRERKIWSLLSEKSRATIRRVNELDEDKIEIADRVAIAEVLNELSGQRELHEAKEFANLAFLNGSGWLGGGNILGPAVEGLRKRLAESFSPEDSRRLNKLLLSGHLSEQLREPQINLIKLRIWKPIVIHVQTLSAHEAFMIYMKASLITALVLGSPMVLWELWRFVAAGLYPHEKRYVWVYLPISVGLFLSGAGLAFFFVFDPVLEFLFQFNASMHIDPDPRISEWLSFVLTLPLGFGGGFQLPLVMLFLNRIGIVEIGTYISKWRIAVMVILVVSMLLTPADPFSMMLMAIPLMFLYVVGIAMCQWMPRGRSPFKEAYEP